MNKILKEFREFAIQGNMIDMAVGIIIGGAFKDLVNSLVNDLLMPLVGMVVGKVDFSNLFLALDGNVYETLAAAQAAEAPTFGYGLFITELINFLIMAFVIFIIVRELNVLKNRKKAPEAPAAPTEKECPYCMTKIHIHATRCPHCTSVLEEPPFGEAG
ncbi:MAG: large conductance mechanosensitive channel protein MscL [Lachnospiraceae bacterium]|nr:large conductance mechanosensitive channel protein MscL [Lachnospiraceae bacterium]